MLAFLANENVIDMFKIKQYNRKGSFEEFEFSLSNGTHSMSPCSEMLHKCEIAIDAQRNKQISEKKQVRRFLSPFSTITALNFC